MAIRKGVCEPPLGYQKESGLWWIRRTEKDIVTTEIWKWNPKDKCWTTPNGVDNLHCMYNTPEDFARNGRTLLGEALPPAEHKAEFRKIIGLLYKVCETIVSQAIWDKPPFSEWYYEIQKIVNKYPSLVEEEK